MLLDTARGDRLEGLYVVAVTAGMREGELLGIKWEDLDLDAGKLAVRRSLSITKDGPAYELLKNGKGRSIKLTAPGRRGPPAPQGRPERRTVGLGPSMEGSRSHLPGPRRPTHARLVANRRPLPPTPQAGRIVGEDPLPRPPPHVRNTPSRQKRAPQDSPGIPRARHNINHPGTYSHVLPGMGDQAANVMDEAL